MSVHVGGGSERERRGEKEREEKQRWDELEVKYADKRQKGRKGNNVRSLGCSARERQAEAAKPRTCQR